MAEKVHFIAIGGSAMHSLAIALAQSGKEVTGSDDAIFDPSKTNLTTHGLLPKQMGWFPKKIASNLDAIILGMHAKSDNPELLRAQELGLKIYSYPEYLYQLTRQKTRIVIAGSHGKTSITAMILHVLKYHSISIDFMVGAALDTYKNSVQLSEENDFVLLEGDEYLSSPIDSKPKFLWYLPQIAVISGIARDHINVFPTESSYEAPFRSFIDSIQPGGVLIYNDQDPKVVRLIDENKNTIKKTPYHAVETEIKEGITYWMTDEGAVPLSFFGQHNMSNLAAAQWVCQLLGVQQEDFIAAIPSFKGAAKRLQQLTKGKTSLLYKDFAHAPSKVQATTEAVKKQYDTQQLIACLELHTYSSLSPEFLPNYRNTLAKADQVHVFYDPEALKIKNRPALKQEAIVEAFGHPNLHVFDRPQTLHQHLLESDYTQSVLLMMSSGNYGGIDWDQLARYVISF
ncbi:MAG: UDP-N-acetylmuramate--L-alanine ligase [Flavobacteriaceae bacterium]